MTYSGRMEQEKQNKRMEIRLPESELAAVERAAGKNKSEWAREAFRLRLCGPLTTGTAAETPFPPDHNMGVGRARQVETGPSEAEDAPSREQAGPASVPSSESEGVRPAVQSQTLAPPEPSGKTAGFEMHGKVPYPIVEFPDAEAKPERINRPRRADVGPKPEAARKPRPKTPAKTKGKR